MTTEQTELKKLLDRALRDKTQVTKYSLIMLLQEAFDLGKLHGAVNVTEVDLNELVKRGRK